jgi:hypothetical protein
MDAVQSDPRVIEVYLGVEDDHTFNAANSAVASDSGSHEQIP